MLEKQQNELSTLIHFMRYSLGKRAPKTPPPYVPDPKAIREDTEEDLIEGDETWGSFTDGMSNL